MYFVVCTWVCPNIRTGGRDFPFPLLTSHGATESKGRESSFPRVIPRSLANHQCPRLDPLGPSALISHLLPVHKCQREHVGKADPVRVLTLDFSQDMAAIKEH